MYYGFSRIYKIKIQGTSTHSESTQVAECLVNDPRSHHLRGFGDVLILTGFSTGDQASKLNPVLHVIREEELSTFRQGKQISRTQSSRQMSRGLDLIFTRKTRQG